MPYTGCRVHEENALNRWEKERLKEIKKRLENERKNEMDKFKEEKEELRKKLFDI